MDEREREAGAQSAPETTRAVADTGDAGAASGGITAALDRYFEAQRLSRRRSILFAALAFSLVGLTITLCWRKIEANFAPERLEQSAAIEAQKVLPTLSNHALSLLREVRPAYEAEGKRALREAVPRIQERLDAEFLHLGEALADRTETRVAEVFPRTADRILRDFYAAFPDLADEVYVHDTLERLKAQIRTETRAVVHEAWQNYRAPTERLAEALGKFPSLEEVPDLELERRFIHLWLLLLDHELMEGSTADDAAPAGPAPRRS